MSVAVLPMAEQYGWGADAKGAIGASFFIGYTVSNFGCILAARLPAKGVLAAGVAMWSAFTLATPAAAAAAAAAGLGPLLAARAAMGVGEGVAYPAIQSLVHDRVPAAARSRALALIYSGHQLGSLASLGAAPPLIAALGWPAVFFCFGSLGFVWLAAWVPVMRVGAPDEAAVEEGSGKPALLAALLAALPAAPAPAPVALADVPWRRFAASKPFWAIVAAQVSAGVGSCLSFSWLPTFYSDVYGVDVAGAAAAAVVPFAGTVVATNAAGWIADGLINNRVLSLTATRKAMQAVASLGPAACLLKLAADQAGGGAGGPPAGGVGAAVAVVTAWLALGGFSAAGYGSNHQDLGGRRYAGVLFGLCNGLASLAGSASIYATGQVLRETHSWALIFESAAAVHVLGAAVYLLWASADEADSFERDEPLRG
jgi:ACS family sodium-dependent inorganic phosphate cotransporter